MDANEVVARGGREETPPASEGGDRIEPTAWAVGYQRAPLTPAPERGGRTPHSTIAPSGRGRRRLHLVLWRPDRDTPQHEKSA